MFPLYTKSFGGKIWTNLHSVSPDNFLGKKFKMASLKISRQKFIWTSPRAKNNFKVKTPILARKKNSENNILTYLLVEMKWNFQPNYSLRNILVFFQTLLHEMRFRIKIFYLRLSFVTQDKCTRPKQFVTTERNWAPRHLLVIFADFRIYFNLNYNLSNSELSST